MRGRRIYRLNGRTISSSRVLGFVHTARKKKGLCYACRKPIELGQRYMVLNNFPFLGDPITVHLDEYVADHPDECILGIKQYRGGWPIKRGYVDCEDFSVGKERFRRSDRHTSKDTANTTLQTKRED